VSSEQKALALLWLFNPTEKPLAAWTCMDIDGFRLSALDVFDSRGRRVPSRPEEEPRKWRSAGTWKQRPRVEICTREFPIEIPAHTCMHGTFSKAEHDFSVDLRTYYPLSPGRYFIVPAEDGADGAPAERTVVEPKNGLELIVLEK
jgi:hypothetical protein